MTTRTERYGHCNLSCSQECSQGHVSQSQSVKAKAKKFGLKVKAKA